MFYESLPFLQRHLSSEIVMVKVQLFLVVCEVAGVILAVAEF